MTSDRSRAAHRPLYAAFLLALIAIAVILTLGTTVQNTPPLFHETQADAAPIAGVPTPTLVPLSGVIPSPQVAPNAPPVVKAAARPTPPTPFVVTYQPIAGIRAPAAVITPAPFITPPTTPTTRPPATQKATAGFTPAPKHPEAGSDTRHSERRTTVGRQSPHLPRFPVATHTRAIAAAGTSGVGHSRSGRNSRSGKR